MTSPFGGQSQMPGLPTPPTGWPIGSYSTYAEAQRAVDHLADNQFPVAEVTIVGVDEVDPLKGKVSWISPIARALIKAREGDRVRLRTPAGEEELEILEVDYP